MELLTLVFLFLALGVIVAIGFVAHSQVIRLLRSQHPETWRELGSPTLFTHSTVLGEFLRKGRFRELGNERLNNRAALNSNLRFSFWVVVIAIVAFFIFVIGDL